MKVSEAEAYRILRSAVDAYLRGENARVLHDAVEEIDGVEEDD